MFIRISVITIIAAAQVLLCFTIHIKTGVISLKHGPDLKSLNEPYFRNGPYFSYLMLYNKPSPNLMTKDVLLSLMILWVDKAQLVNSYLGSLIMLQLDVGQN